MFQPQTHNSGRHDALIGSSSRGVTLTAAGSANTKGTYADIGSNTTFAWEAFTICISRNSAAANYMLDIALGEATTEAIILPDFYFAAAKQANEQSLQLTIPLHVPNNSQLRGRVACSTASATCDVAIIGHETGFCPGFSRATALFTPSSSRGVAIDPGGSANTKGSWTQLIASAPAIAGMFGLVGFNNDVARGANGRMLLDIGVGASGLEATLYPNTFWGWSTVRDGPANCVRIPPFSCCIASASRIVARAQCDVATAGDRTIDLALYGLVI